MIKHRAISFLLAAVFILCAASGPVVSTAAEPALEDAKLNRWQYYFARTVMSIALKDSFDAKIETGKNIFPSITCGQACFEGGICGAPISVIGKNHFAVRAYEYFTGKVYDDNELVVYNSYSDAVNIKGEEYVRETGLWRAYDSWEECIRDHTQMLLSQPRYESFVTASDYEEAAQAYQDIKHKGEKANYKSNLLKRVEGYGFVGLDHVTADENGIFGLIMSESNILLSRGDTCLLSAQSYPATDYDCSTEIVWESHDPDIVSVDGGKVTALAPGYALITATYHDKEACCVVCVDCNGYNMYSATSLYATPSADSAKIGKLMKGQPVHVDDMTPVISADGAAYYAITARTADAELRRGYARADRIYAITESRGSVSAESPFVALAVGEEKDIELTVEAEELKEKEFRWESSNSELVAVSNAGRAKAVAEGIAVLSIFADDLRVLTVPVVAGDAEPKRLTTEKALDLRIRPVNNKTDNEYGTVRQGTSAWLLDDTVKGWYRVLTYADGRYYDGYAKHIYFSEDDAWSPSLIATLASAFDQSSEPEDDCLDGYTHSDDDPYILTDKYISGIRAGTTVADLDSAFSADLRVMRNDAELADADALATGDIAIFVDANDITESMREIAVAGDIDGDGAVNASDCLRIKRHLLGTEILEGAKYAAGCVSGGQCIGTADYIMIKSSILAH